MGPARFPCAKVLCVADFPVEHFKSTLRSCKVENKAQCIISQLVLLVVVLTSFQPCIIEKNAAKPCSSLELLRTRETTIDAVYEFANRKNTLFSLLISTYFMSLI